ncbi:GNAT family N-acetyltransferase [Luteimonas kalidii]|uniref:GNAT family N-acetyltransferase n=1 Tax=Luteimonas kalidii TaxID=3042025 RepID=A0ABT6JVI0_9GAMM|nr:GNAT family N-acetyltransferase [Luteimonas kalidii]MDH5834694.1 GNAT family N-acetyltransferase [Luteimonas kalidii]
MRAVDPRRDAADWGRLRAALWPDEAGVNGDDDLHEALSPGIDTCVLLAVAPHDGTIGFAEARRRREYVNGATTSPVGFLEAWYVVPQWRGRGVGRMLVAGVEAWARGRGCSELASDALLRNMPAHAAHLGCGFVETGRVVYFLKRLEP